MKFGRGIEAHGPVESNPEKEFSIKELKDTIEAGLYLGLCHFDDDACIQEWLNKNDEVFHFAFDNLLARYSNLAELWNTDKDAVLENMRAEMKALSSDRQAA